MAKWLPCLALMIVFMCVLVLVDVALHWRDLSAQKRELKERTHLKSTKIGTEDAHLVDIRQIGIMFSSISSYNQTRVALLSYSKIQPLTDSSSKRLEMVVMTNCVSGTKNADELVALTTEFGYTLVFTAPLSERLRQRLPWLDEKIPFNNLRVLIMQEWFRQNELGIQRRDRVFFADEDLVYTGNVFEIFDSHKASSLFVFAERTGLNSTIGQNQKWLNATLLNPRLKSFVAISQVYCFGFVIGEFWALQQLTERLITVFFTQGFPQESKVATDQSAFNVLIHSHMLDDLKLQRVPIEEPWVVNVAALNAYLRSREPQYVPFLAENVFKTRRVVHQYKWNKEYKNMIYKLFGVVVKHAWEKD